MTDSNAKPDAQPPDVAPDADLAEYFRANLSQFTEAALVAGARKRGYSDMAIQAALEAGRAGVAAAPVRRRAVTAITAAYLVTYLLLDLGMIVNESRVSGEFMPSSGGGIAILTVSLGVAFAASMAWMRNRRTFGLFFFAALTLVTLPNVPSLSPTALIPAAIGIVGFIWLYRRRDVGASSATGTEALVAVPLLLLVVVGGICLASGLPIPRAS